MRLSVVRNIAVLHKEMRTRMRGRRAAVIITVYLLLISSVAGLMLYGQQQALQSGLSSSRSPTIGHELFVTLSLFQLFLVIFIVPGLTGAAIAGERDRQTLDLMLSTQVPSLWIVLGKLLSSLSYVFLLMVAALPLFSLVFLFGGVSPGQVVLAFAVSLISALTLGTIGVFISVVIRRGQIATVLCYAVAFLLIVGTSMLSIFIAIGSDTSTDIPVTVVTPLVLNPLAALASATAAPFLPDAPLFGTSHPAPNSELALWHFSLIADAVLISTFLFLAATLLRPRRLRSQRLGRSHHVKVKR